MNVLRDNANHLAEIDQRDYDAGDLFAFEMVQAVTMGTPSYLETVQDAYCHAPELALSFERYFLPDPSYRARLGTLGRGWTHSYEITLQKRSDGSVVVNGPSGFDRIFEPDGHGGYTAGTGDYGLLTAQPDDEFLLVEQNGLQTHFRSDGYFDSIQDTNGNRIFASYDALGRLVTLAHSNGDRFRLDYDAAGRLVKLTDQAGRITQYVYDATDEHLISVTGPDNQTTTYTYLTGAGVLKDHNLLSISRPGRPQVSFSYDNLGRLAGQHLAADQERITYTYSTAGKTSMSDALGSTTTIWLDSRGQTAMIEDPLGNRSRMNYSAALDLTRVVGPTGLASQFIYDSAGNLIVSRDPMGYETAFGYGGRYNDLLWDRDARGNVTQYAYDDHGNVTRTTYMDGSFETYQYDGVGNLIAWTNGRGETTTYTYNSRGQLASIDSPDTPGVVDFHYTYDTVGNMTAASGPEGTTTFTYEPNTDRLLRIDYPPIGTKSIFFTFEYDAAGRRIKRTDQDGDAINYSYDAAGRLDRVTDGIGALIVDYDYDLAGQLTRKTLGNSFCTTYDYDLAGQLTHLVNLKADGTPLSRFDYTYDALGQATLVQMLDGAWTYQYDDDSQLVHATLASTNPAISDQDLTYAYDAVGNRIYTVTNGVATEYVTNNMNQYVRVGNAIYTYDADGNMVSKTEDGITTTYTYNPISQLVRVSSPTDNEVYTYNAIGNRIAATYGSATTKYVVDPVGTGDVVAEYDGNGDRVALYRHGYGLISRSDRSGTQAYYTFSAIGNTSELTSSAGTVLNTYSYDPFGTLLAMRETVPNPYGFVGEHGVLKANNAVTFMKSRYYACDLGRFTAPDTLGLHGGDINLYRYVENSPVIMVDPLGFGHWVKWSLVNPNSKLMTDLSNLDEESDEANLEWVHEQYVFDDGSNVGFDAGTGKSDPTGPGGTFSKAKTPDGVPVDKVESSAIPKGAVKSSDEYDDEIMKEAIKNVEARCKANKGRYDVIWHNCQDWADEVRDEYEKLKKKKEQEKKTGIVTSISPEDKWGPTGYDAPGTPAGSEQRYVTPSGTFGYRIEMWNKPDALAPTQDASIYDVLDPNVFDLSTFQFTRVGFLKWDVTITSGQSIDTRIDCRPDMNIAVDVKGTFNPTTGRIDWWFHTVDPDTGDYPSDPMAGFLPPFNPATGYEIGWMEFTVQLKSSLPSGTQIANQAFVQFDFLGPWGPAPKTGPWINTIDAGLPTSQVETLPERTRATSVLVSWTDSHDDEHGSGIASYDVYYRVNDDPSYVLWLDDTTQTSATFTGNAGNTYWFYSIATDNVGHQEAPPAIPDAHTLLLPNRTPVAVNDPYTTDEDTALTVAAAGVLANDTDADSDPLTVSTVQGQAANVGTQITLASGALVTVNANGSLTYDPNGAFESLDDGETATDTFTYRANDGTVDSNMATVTITISGRNDAPVAVNDSYATDEDTVLTVPVAGVLTNDTDADSDPLTVSTVQGQAANVGTQITLASGRW